MPESPIYRLLRPSPIVLPAESGLGRIPPRPAAKRQTDYLEQYDDNTLFYDVFRSGSEIVLSGPPLLNLREDLRTARWFVDGTEASPQLADAGKIQRSSIAIPKQVRIPAGLDRDRRSGRAHSRSSRQAPRRLSVELPSGQELHTTIGKSRHQLFRDRRTLLTKSKNNDLQWIKDWASFHARAHGVDAVLLYDNESDSYTSAEVLAALVSVSEIKVAVVMEWPFKFGPQGGNWGGVRNAPWDSAYCESGILEDARRRFLPHAAGVLHHDIDELAITDDSRSVFDHVADSDTGGIAYHGHWIADVAEDHSDPARFTDYVYHDISRPATTRKWVIDPRRFTSEQWSTHSMPGGQLRLTPHVAHRHFTAITTSWKYRRRKLSTRPDPAKHVLDRDLLQHFRLYLSEPASPTIAPMRSVSLETATRSGTEELVALIDPRRRFGSTLRRIDATQPDVLVLEFQDRHGMRYTVDVGLAAPERHTMSITGLDDSARYAIRKAIRGLGESIDNAARVNLISWPQNTPVQEVALDAVGLLEKVTTTLALYASLDVSPRSIPSYWYDIRVNFGDLIGPLIIEILTGRPVHNTIGRPDAGDALVTVGSVLTVLQRRDLTIWGSGLLAPLNRTSIRRLSTRRPRELLGVRGRLTRDQVVQHLGWSVPNRFGDPALILPEIYEPVPTDTSGQIAVCPHYLHTKLVLPAADRSAKCTLVRVNRDATTVIDELASASAVMSSSLHGLVVAQAYGIPWIWLKITDKQLPGEEFKFEDFFSTLDRDAVVSVQLSRNDLRTVDLAELAGRARLPGSNFRAGDLLDTFPYSINRQPRI